MTGQSSKPAYWLAIIGFAILIAGALLANAIRTSDGTQVRDIRFTGTNGTQMSALLYIPKGATAKTPAPGILTVHGYINSREMQDPFAIEFARRGYVVLSVDQTGHGYSDGPAGANGFGGPDGLAYLRSLPVVDKTQIGMEGHSMGGWTILAAAAAMPDAYQSLVLEGSSTGAPFAVEGSPTWPRNMALVFSRYDEFSKIMWNVDRAVDVGQSPKLQAVFGTKMPVVESALYGDIAAGTARTLHQPGTTHPGDHLSRAAIGHATDWFARTLKGGTPRPASDQIWIWKEVGTGIGLIGFVMILLGAFDALIRTPAFTALRGQAEPGATARDRRWWTGFAISSLIPALLFFPAFVTVYLLIPPMMLLPQVVTTQVTIWALAGAGIAWIINRKRLANAPKRKQPDWLLSLLIAAASLAAGYAALILIDRLFALDIRFWIVAVKLPSPSQLGSAALYVVPITAAFLVTLRGLCDDLTVKGDSAAMRYGTAILALNGGFILLFGSAYALFFATGSLFTAFDPLSTVIALQFIPVLAAIAIITIFTWHRTGSHRPGALIAGMLVTLYVTAGTATQV